MPDTDSIGDRVGIGCLSASGMRDLDVHQNAAPILPSSEFDRMRLLEVRPGSPILCVKCTLNGLDIVVQDV